MSEILLNKTIRKFWSNKTLYQILNGIIYGWLLPKLHELDRIRYKRQIRYFNMDACEGDIPHKLGPGSGTRTIVLNASTNRVADDYGLWLDDTMMLEKAGEGYRKLYQRQFSKIMANNMKYAEDSNGELQCSINTDMATEANVDNIRNSILYGLKTQLKLDQKEIRWYNKKTKTVFKLDSLAINVKSLSLYMHNLI